MRPQDFQTALEIAGFGKGGGGGGHGGGGHGGGGHGGGGHMGGGHGGGFRRGFRGRRFFGGQGFFDWPWWWGPDVYVEPSSCAWMPPRGAVPSDVVATLSKIPFQAGWRAAFVGGGWWGEAQSPHAYFVCVVSDTLFAGLYGLDLPNGIIRGFGMDYVEKPTPGDYHLNGNVVLRAQPLYKSQAIATLQKGENVYVFGDTETDPGYWILDNDQVIPNNDPDNQAGIDYVHVGTQTHGPGWVAMVYVDPGAGTKFGAPQPQPQPQPKPTPTPTPTPTPSPAPGPSPAPAVSGMGLPTKILLGTAIAATIAGGGYLVWQAVKGSRPRLLAHA